MAQVPVYGIDAFQKETSDPSFYANDLKAHLQSHKFVNHPHSHTTYITILFTQGSGVHHIDFENYPVKPWTVFLLSPGQVHAWQLSDDTEGYVFFHTRSFYNDVYFTNKIEDFPFFYLSQNYPLVEVLESDRLPLADLFRQILSENKSSMGLKEVKIHSLVTLVYVQLSRIYKNQDSHHENENQLRVRNLQKFIDLHFKTHKLPKDYSDMMHMSTRHLTRICNEILGCSTSDLIQERIILEAKRLLTYSKETVSSVAYMLGYEDVSYFSRFFKTKAGLTPKEFREKINS